MTIVRTTVPIEVSAKLDARQAQYTQSDYNRQGDTRPYQVVMAAYPAPKFLQTFQNLRDGLRQCESLCRVTGQPFRVVKWGSRVPCVPCDIPQTAKLPHFVVRSKGALAGYPEAVPIAEVSPEKGVVIYGPKGEEMLVGSPNYVASRKPFPEAPEPGTPLRQRYLQAVETAQYLAGREGTRAYVCAGFNVPCKRSKKYMPVVYVDPGAVVPRYGDELPLGPGAASTPGSTSITTPVTPQEFRELLAMSDGATFLGQGY